MTREIKILEEKFEYAHYLPDHEKCGALHGHTGFIRNIVIQYNELDTFVDFGAVKAHIKNNYDHKLIIPVGHLKVWKDQLEPILKTLGIHLEIKTVEGPPTVEILSETIAKELKSMRGIEAISLEMYEGPLQGAIVSLK